MLGPLSVLKSNSFNRIQLINVVGIDTGASDLIRIQLNLNASVHSCINNIEICFMPWCLIVNFPFSFLYSPL